MSRSSFKRSRTFWAGALFGAGAGLTYSGYLLTCSTLGDLGPPPWWAGTGFMIMGVLAMVKGFVEGKRDDS